MYRAFPLTQLLIVSLVIIYLLDILFHSMGHTFSFCVECVERLCELGMRVAHSYGARSAVHLCQIHVHYRLERLERFHC